MNIKWSSSAAYRLTATGDAAFQVLSYANAAFPPISLLGLEAPVANPPIIPTSTDRVMLWPCGACYGVCSAVLLSADLMMALIAFYTLLSV